MTQYHDNKGRVYDIPDASNDDQEEDPGVHDLDDQDERSDLESNGIKLRPGQATEIVLRENPSTGYEWYDDAFECTGVVDIESSYQAPSENETQGMVGVAGMRTFTLTAQKPGSCYFRIAQERAY